MATAKLNSHIAGAIPDFLNACLAIHTLGEPGAGGAHSEYVVYRSHDGAPPNLGDLFANVRFQSGDPDHGVNGATNEALLAILIHRLECFQAGPFPCRENALALTKLQEAMMWLHARTRERISRHVDGRQQS